jgi:dephospho-CoA kinase
VNGREFESVVSERRGTLATTAPVIGLIGPIGCGKSTVAGWLAERGTAIVDADELTRNLMTPGSPVTDAIVARFGADLLRPDGSLDRGRLGRLVFADPASLFDLESIVHPAVARLERDAIRAADALKPRAIAIEAVKLVEAGHAAWCEEVWLIVCEPEVQLARLVGRGVPPDDARQRISAQAKSLPLWRSAATRIIRTDGPVAEVEATVGSALESVVSGSGEN